MFKKLFILCLLMACVASAALAQTTMDTTFTNSKIWVAGNELSGPLNIKLTNGMLTANRWPIHPSILQQQSVPQITPSKAICDRQSFINELYRQRAALQSNSTPDRLNQATLTALLQRGDLVVRAEPFRGDIKVWWQGEKEAELLSCSDIEPEQSSDVGLRNLYTDLIFALKTGYWIIVGADGSTYYVAPSDQATVAAEIQSASVWANSQMDQRPPRSYKLPFDRVKEFAHPLPKPIGR